MARFNSYLQWQALYREAQPGRLRACGLDGLTNFSKSQVLLHTDIDLQFGTVKAD
jgi:hypothetical protein